MKFGKNAWGRLGILVFLLNLDINVAQGQICPKEESYQVEIPLSNEKPLPLIDGHEEGDSLPTKYRTSLSLPHAHADRLRMSGSAQYSSKNLKMIIADLKAKGVAQEDIYLIDLRQESHGFINGLPVGWFGLFDWANKGKSREQVEEDQQKRLQAVKAKTKTGLFEMAVKTHDQTTMVVTPRTVPVRTVLSEKELAKGNKVKYARFTVTDHLAPEDAEVERFLEFVENLPPKAWLHFHCKGGKGRTTTFMTMYDILKNAHHMELSDILERQRSIDGSNLQALPDPSSFKYEAAKNRIDYIQNFYQYVKSTGLGISWTKWQSSQKN